MNTVALRSSKERNYFLGSDGGQGGTEGAKSQAHKGANNKVDMEPCFLCDQS